MKWTYFFYIAAGYLCGGILFSWILPKILKGVDIVKVSEDHNPGTANAVKYGGIWVGLACLVLDLAKGFLPVHFALKNLDPGDSLFVFVVMAPVLGHAFPLMAKFKGGKSIAALFGVSFALLPVVPLGWVLAALYIFFSAFLVIRTNAYCSALTMALLIVYTLVFHAFQPAAFGIAAAAAVVLIKHIPSMKREPFSVHPPLFLEAGKVRNCVRKPENHH